MIRPIRDIKDEPVGGKARGLRELLHMGLNVPEAFVLIHPRADQITDELLAGPVSKLGEGPKAVRSSAVSEDGATVSFAGQFETYLGLNTIPEIRDAIKNCILTSQAERVRSYSSNLSSNADLRISVILQKMVIPRVAGVVFTANPVSNRRDKVVVNAVAGHGEALVSGSRDAHQYEVFGNGSNLVAEVKKNGHLLNEDQLREIVSGAKKAERHYGRPLDLEWAIDHEGHLHWLQVRPVTTLDDVHFNELDSVKIPSTDIWTLGNIGEMMPGVATPLTWTVSAEAIDYGMVVLADRSGAFRLKDRKEPRYIQMFYNRLFINMSHMMDYPKHVWLNTSADVQFALSGKVFPGLETKPEGWFPVRALNFMRQMINTSRGKHYLDLLRRLESDFIIDLSGPMEEILSNLREARHQLGIGFGYHLGTSAQSGTLYSAFIRIMTGDKRKPAPEDHNIATRLLLNIPDIESADAVKSLERFANLIRSDLEFAPLFVAASPEEALHMLQHSAPEPVQNYFRNFLVRHGHRCVREAELREKTWGDNPLQLIQSLQTSVKTGAGIHHTHHSRSESLGALKELPFIKRYILKTLMKTARQAVARREITKGLSIRMVHKMRKGFQKLAEMMVESRLLDDTDQIYFLTLDELGMALTDKDPGWKVKAGKRRQMISLVDKLEFDDVSHGIPQPLEHSPAIELTEGQLKGIPVSSGTYEGRVRIINDLKSAELLRDGEIMVAAFTDIGWTPYFSIIGALITEIGSPLSHGAVVAREYGIPAVVGAKGARRFLRDGDLVRIHGDKGIIEKL